MEKKQFNILSYPNGDQEIEYAHINFYTETDDSFGIELSEIQLKTVLSVLGLDFQADSYQCFSDEQIEALLPQFESIINSAE